METKTLSLTNGELRVIGLTLGQIWAEEKRKINLSGKGMYYLLKLKQEIDAKNLIINEAFMTIGQNHGGTINEDGNMQIPPENIEVVNKELAEIADEKIEIQYSPVILTDSDNIPVSLMEVLLPFIDFKE